MTFRNVHPTKAIVEDDEIGCPTWLFAEPTKMRQNPSDLLVPRGRNGTQKRETMTHAHTVCGMSPQTLARIYTVSNECTGPPAS